MLSKLLRPLYLRLWILPRTHRTYGTLSAANTFRKIYQTKAWGDNGKPFCSGLGSHGLIYEQYCALAIDFIRKHQVKSVVDLGCGDFAVGKQIVEATGVRYTGIDIVPELIEHLRAT